MLEPVALSQTGFKMPGVMPDSRGVLVGKQGAVLLPSLDRLMTFLRLLSEHGSLDDLLPALRILQVKSRLGAPEFLLILSAATSYVLDRLSRLAALSGGMTGTGAGKHFVKYRDRRSPLGYDVDALSGEAADYIFYAEAFTQGYSLVREVPFAGLLFQLSLRQVPFGAAAHLSSREVLWVGARAGLAPKLLGYLFRNRVRFAGCHLLSDEIEAVSGSGEERLFGERREDRMLLRVSDLPLRMLELFIHVPGIEIYRPLGDNFVMEIGYRHPMRLESCASVFDKERFYLFAGRRGVCEVLVSPPPLLPAEGLLRLDYRGDGKGGTQFVKRKPAPPPEYQLRLLLGRSSQPLRRVKATLLPWERVDLFKQLVYLMPPTLLEGYQMAAIEEGIFVFSPQGIDGLPIGDLFHEVAPSVYAPAGMDFLPRVSEAVLSEQLGGTADKVVVLLPRAGGEVVPLSLPHAAFDRLDRKALAPLRPLPRRRIGAPQPGERREATLVNDPLGAAPLLGFRDTDPGAPDKPGR